MRISCSKLETKSAGQLIDNDKDCKLYDTNYSEYEYLLHITPEVVPHRSYICCLVESLQLFYLAFCK